MSNILLEAAPLPGLTTLTLNRPDQRNALSVALTTAVCDTIDRLSADASQRIVILNGNGPVFCAGLDLKEAAQDERAADSAECFRRGLQTLQETSLITIIAAHGGAYAGGAGLMAACDMVIAADDLRVAFPAARRGLLPALICGIVETKVSSGDLRELFLCGEPIDAHRAQQVGLVQRVVSRDRLEEEALTAARSILAGGPETVRETKRLLNDAYGTQRQRFGNDQPAVQLEASHKPEAREGLAAFIEKRPPHWTISDG